MKVGCVRSVVEKSSSTSNAATSPPWARERKPVALYIERPWSGRSVVLYSLPCSPRLLKYE